MIITKGSYSLIVCTSKKYKKKQKNKTTNLQEKTPTGNSHSIQQNHTHSN